jgi:hypothetical protein
MHGACGAVSMTGASGLIMTERIILFFALLFLFFLKKKE